ncbi:MAG: RagB/SusD family nutrient uptake outer membrane protein [Chitinophagaceae bacterium]|nr:RagB/SusD family nutrient uptake outer membrane protein [Chitinophagaceae bacterium]
MKRTTNNIQNLLLALAAVVTVVSCSKLDVKIKDPNSIAPATSGGAPTPSTLSKVYEQLNQLIGQGNWYAMSEHTTDELMGPTRGTDWDDFGTWRKLHLHAWDGSHNQINDTWNGLNGALFQTTLLAETATGQTQAEAKFLRAYFSYIVCDLFGQVQHRPATAEVQELPEVYSRSEAVDFIISELEAIIPTLPAYTHATRNVATKEAARFLLAKTYLNKAVFKQDPNNPAGPFTFDAADMNKVIALCNAIAANPDLGIDNNYWDNFTWDNGTKSSENIFVRQNSQGINLVWATCMGNHYNMPPDGWNGFTTLAEFYNSFADGDVRKSSAIPGFTDVAGRPAGFLVGQQRGPQGKTIGNPIVDLKDRSGNPLIFTSDASLFFSTESKGIRTNKWPLDPSTMNSGGWGSTNEFAFFRLADARLMKAEAILRGGTDAETPLSIVNNIRANRNASALGSVNLDALLAERGRELYLEAWRRNDLIRFGKFNEPTNQRTQTSPGYRVVFPIPNIALSSNPNLKQNVGY